MGSGLEQAVNINESVKVVRQHCRRINVLGMNALVLAQNVGQEAKGFVAMAHEVRMLSLQLGRLMDRLYDLSIKALEEDSDKCRGDSRHQVFERAAAGSEICAEQLTEVLSHHEYHRDLRLAQGKNLHKLLSETVDEAQRLILFGVAIARQAHIESTYSHERSHQLITLSGAFRTEIDAVEPRLQELAKIMESRR